MTYSNTKKDNVQANCKSRLKNWAVVIFLITVIVSSLSNIINQYKTLKEAQKTNSILESENSQISQEIRDLKQKTEYASSSAYRQRRARQFLGLGNSSDRWVILPKIDGNINIGQSFSEQAVKPNFILWWEKFTK